MGLTIALNRGRILEESLPLLASAGIVLEEDPAGSRKLIIASREGEHRLVVMRGADVPTYVEYGAADVGIVGKDTLLEHGGSAGYYERLDLGIARCRIMVAAPVGTGLGDGKLRVATKFPRVARRYFEGQGRQVSIIKLNGAMEIAPLMNLADCIVDIVDTGNTLRANGLEALETIAHVSSRMIVNRAAMKTRFEAVQSLICSLRDVTG
ncbi:MAG: ATP phosphoribosyltransferase [Pseudomonadales bacterium]|nr:ATP phosphoribosyltransferase [Pseudomonadales bacterium]NIX06904.1 ATP phosphoribosyltransferase [Pseudomonadales bacterium]